MRPIQYLEIFLAISPIVALQLNRTWSISSLPPLPPQTDNPSAMRQSSHNMHLAENNRILVDESNVSAVSVDRISIGTYDELSSQRLFHGLIYIQNSITIRGIGDIPLETTNRSTACIGIRCLDQELLRTINITDQSWISRP